MFLGIDGSEGLICHKVREKDLDETEVSRLVGMGYSRKVTTNPQTNDDVVSYRKYWPSVTGYITGFKLDTEAQFGERVSITIEDDDERNVISMNLYSQMGSMNGYIADFAKHADNIPLDEQIIFGANRKLKNEKGYLVQLLNLKYLERANDMGPELIKRAVKKEQLPELKEKKKGGKTVYDSDDRDAFLYGLLQKFAERVEKDKHRFGQDSSHDTYNPNSAAGSTTQQSSAPQNNAPVSQAPQNIEEDEEGLPF